MSKKRKGFIETIINASDELPEAEFRAGIEARQALLKRKQPRRADIPAITRAATKRADAAKAKTNAAAASSEPSSSSSEPSEQVQ